MAIKKNDILFTLGLASSIWFILTSWFWAWLIALFLAYPFGLVGLICWLLIKNEGRKRTKWIHILLIIGLVISISAIYLYR